MCCDYHLQTDLHPFSLALDSAVSSFHLNSPEITDPQRLDRSFCCDYSIQTSLHSFFHCLAVAFIYLNPSGIVYFKKPHYPPPTYISSILHPHKMSLSKFPPEILLHIVNVVSPGDIEQLAMSCKTVKSLAKQRLRTHAEMKCKYTQLMFCNIHVMGMENKDPALFLRDVLFNEHVAFYPQDITIGSLSHLVWQGVQGELAPNAPAHSEDFESFFEDVQDTLWKKLQECPYLDDDDVQSLWEKITGGHQLATVPLLITLLPNLRTMYVYTPEIPGENSDDRLVHDMMLAIAKASSDSERLIRRSPPLGKLTAVELNTGLDFGDLLSFAALPSMRSTGGMRLVNHRIDQTSGMDISRLWTLKLSMGTVECDSLIEFLGGLNALKILIYHNGDVEFQPRRILAMLEERAALSRTHLTLTNPTISGPTPDLADCYFGSKNRLTQDLTIFFTSMAW